MSEERIIRQAARHAKMARHVGAWIQPVFVAAVFVLWVILHRPFWTSAEYCVVAGVFVYSSLNVYAAIICAWGGDGHVLASRVSRLLGVILFIVMKYFLHYGFFKCVGVWLVLWIVAWWLARKSRRRALAGAPVGLSGPRVVGKRT